MSDAADATKETRRSSRRSSSRASGDGKTKKRISKTRKKAKEAFDLAKVLAHAATTAWTFSFMTIMFLVVYVMHFVMDQVNQMRAKRLTRREEVMLMGKIFRRSSAFFVVDMNPFWSLTSTAEVPLEELPKSCIFMANHLSFADAFVLCAAQRPLETKWVGKGDLWTLPIMGKAMHHSGDMPVAFVRDKGTGRWRTKTGTTEKLMEQARDYLDDDIPITVFPEGTISRTGEIKPFKKGFFRLAVVTGSPIVPMAQWGSNYAWPTDPEPDVSSGSPILSPAEIHVRFGAPISSVGKSVGQLMCEVHTAIETMRNALPNFDLDPKLAVSDVEALYMAPAKRKSQRLEEVPEESDAPEEDDDNIRVDAA